ncbi:hypothetical protein OIU76_029957 [Salix suchowensis]|nr:hypothetical protein OIU76_029957 [Salix suchowensis]
MEDEGIQAVLAKAIDLRLKISNCIHKATTTNITSNKKTSSFEEEEQESEGLGEKGWKKKSPESSEFLDGVSLSEAEDDETERFFHIRDALESLESQLSNLQVSFSSYYDFNFFVKVSVFVVKTEPLVTLSVFLR